MSTLTVGTLTNQDVQLCKAWVNFNGTGTVAINASHNVSSITDNGTGDYTVNYTTPMTAADYVANVTQENEVSVAVGFAGIKGSHLTASITVTTLNAAGAAIDRSNINVSIFAN